MQYSVVGADGHQYGPVDLMTLKQWVTEGRVLPNSQIVDNLSNVTLLASQMPELGMISAGRPTTDTNAPPLAYGEYPRGNVPMPTVKRGTRLWGIIFWLAVGIVFSMFYKFGGVIVSGWNLFDAFKAKAEDDPKANWCIGVSVVGFAIILLWTYIKAQAL